MYSHCFPARFARAFESKPSVSLSRPSLLNRHCAIIAGRFDRESNDSILRNRPFAGAAFFATCEPAYSLNARALVTPQRQATGRLAKGTRKSLVELRRER